MSRQFLVILACGAVLVIAGVVFLVGRSSDGSGTATSSPAATPSSPTAQPSAPPVALEPVRGKLEVIPVLVGDRHVIRARSARPPRPASKQIRAVARKAGRWIDAHLTALQAGREGVRRGVPGYLRRSRAMTTGLLPRGAVVKRAVYRMRVAHDAKPKWLSVRVIIHHRRGRSAADLVFARGRRGIRLIAVGPVGGR